GHARPVVRPAARRPGAGVGERRRGLHADPAVHLPVRRAAARARREQPLRLGVGRSGRGPGHRRGGGEGGPGGLARRRLWLRAPRSLRRGRTLRRGRPRLFLLLLTPPPGLEEGGRAVPDPRSIVVRRGRRAARYSMRTTGGWAPRPSGPDAGRPGRGPEHSPR